MWSNVSNIQWQMILGVQKNSVTREYYCRVKRNGERTASFPVPRTPFLRNRTSKIYPRCPPNQEIAPSQFEPKRWPSQAGQCFCPQTPLRTWPRGPIVIIFHMYSKTHYILSKLHLVSQACLRAFFPTSAPARIRCVGCFYHVRRNQRISFRSRRFRRQWGRKGRLLQNHLVPRRSFFRREALHRKNHRVQQQEGKTPNANSIWESRTIARILSRRCKKLEIH